MKVGQNGNHECEGLGHRQVTTGRSLREGFDPFARAMRTEMNGREAPPSTLRQNKRGKDIPPRTTPSLGLMNSVHRPLPKTRCQRVVQVFRRDAGWQASHYQPAGSTVGDSRRDSARG